MKGSDFVELVKKRGRMSKVFKKYQWDGLEIAALLKDESHKTLYIKLVKENPNLDLVALARDISSRKNIGNKGAYFMTLFNKRYESK